MRGNYYTGDTEMYVQHVLTPDDADRLHSLVSLLSFLHGLQHFTLSSGADRDEEHQ